MMFLCVLDVGQLSPTTENSFLTENYQTINQKREKNQRSIKIKHAKTKACFFMEVIIYGKKEKSTVP